MLLEGAVELIGRTSGARETTIQILWPVDCFIPAAALTSTPYLMAARTLEPSQILMLEASNLRRCVREDAGLASIMIALLAGQFREMVRQVKDLKLRTGTQRLACFLLRLWDETGEGGAARLPFSKGALASRLGMTAENLSRAFRNLEQAGLEVRGSRIVVRDRDKLEAICCLDALIDKQDAALSVQDR